LQFKLRYEFSKEGLPWHPSLPEGVKIYAFGDIHGRLDLLDTCLSQIDDDISRSKDVQPIHVFLGDYIDRGPRSRQTIERLLDRSKNHRCLFLSGNHEQLALRALEDIAVMPTWLRLGGAETLASYGVRAKKNPNSHDLAAIQSAFGQAVSGPHLTFFGNLKSHFSCGNYFFVHAGVKPGVSLDRQSERDLFWIRDESLDSVVDFGKLIVHGHTPAPQIEVRQNRINIDTGAYATGLLTCLVLENTELSIINSSKR
jgi:serine/threonine protein phosphatase 1